MNLDAINAWRLTNHLLRTMPNIHRLQTRYANWRRLVFKGNRRRIAAEFERKLSEEVKSMWDTADEFKIGKLNLVIDRLQENLNEFEDD